MWLYFSLIVLFWEKGISDLGALRSWYSLGRSIYAVDDGGFRQSALPTVRRK